MEASMTNGLFEHGVPPKSLLYRRRHLMVKPDQFDHGTYHQLTIIQFLVPYHIYIYIYMHAVHILIIKYYNTDIYIYISIPISILPLLLALQPARQGHFGLGTSSQPWHRFSRPQVPWWWGFRPELKDQVHGPKNGLTLVMGQFSDPFWAMILTPKIGS